MKHTNSLQYEASQTTQVTNQLLQPPLIRHQRRKSNLCSDGTARIHLAKYKSRFQEERESTQTPKALHKYYINTKTDFHTRMSTRLANKEHPCDNSLGLIP